jgi:hypothetical protein
MGKWYKHMEEINLTISDTSLIFKIKLLKRHVRNSAESSFILQNSAYLRVKPQIYTTEK